MNFENPSIESSNENGINIYYYSYYDYDENEKEYFTNPGFKNEIEFIDIAKTALIVVDPWSDSLFPELNEMIQSNVDTYVVPMVEVAIDGGMPVYIFTNNPELIDYSTEICGSLEKLVQESNDVNILYYDQIDGTLGFIEYLNENGIENLIYTGYATQMCVLYRNIGIIPMCFNSELNIYIVPEATAAVVGNNEEKNIQMRNDICIMLSQENFAGIMQYDDYMKYFD